MIRQDDKLLGQTRSRKQIKRWRKYEIWNLKQIETLNVLFYNAWEKVCNEKFPLSQNFGAVESNFFIKATQQFTPDKNVFSL